MINYYALNEIIYVDKRSGFEPEKVYVLYFFQPGALLLAVVGFMRGLRGSLRGQHLVLSQIMKNDDFLEKNAKKWKNVDIQTKIQ